MDRTDLLGDISDLSSADGFGGTGQPLSSPFTVNMVYEMRRGLGFAI